MRSLNKEIGKLGEDIAVNYLLNSEYIILDRNYKCKIGEIDIIGKDNEYITFIEVKTRSSLMYGTPSEAVNKVKQYKIYKVAQMYILKKNLFNFKFRFDVIEVILDKENHYSIHLIKDAFQI